MTLGLKYIALTIIGILLHAPQAMATGSIGDIILLDGQEWEMLDKPIEADSALSTSLKNFLPKERNWSTANWEGYTAYWIIKDDYLYLQKVQVDMHDEENGGKEYSIEYDAEALKDVFAPYYSSEGISAKWFSRNIRLGRGKLILYEHAGFNRNTEEECLITLQVGKVEKKQYFHNYKKEGLTLPEVRAELIKRFPFHDFPEIEQQKRIVLIMTKIQLTKDGHFADGNLSVKVGSEKIDDQEHPIIKVMKKSLASIYPWETYYINGEYRSSTTNFAMPLILPD